MLFLKILLATFIGLTTLVGYIILSGYLVNTYGFYGFIGWICITSILFSTVVYFEKIIIDRNL